MEHNADAAIIWKLQKGGTPGTGEKGAQKEKDPMAVIQSRGEHLPKIAGHVGTDKM